MTNKGVKTCAEWLIFCLSIGYKKSQLDALEKLWLKYHNDMGELI
jgi:hypothetical protein